ncbi:nucleoside triphosphate pyrophosphohydrolase [Anaerorhabdus furcosa]|uniref:Predicted house-cleaning noncanonical NTP pyrophosphatase, all-alpha NTP-PPase (MazG) superfamily n=1 Tax=Anaerorhabdus furcosa TaxID=118967 RepID=A0A1T4NI44_9FIRM|nr:nucleoside triphosphate pyrophosphohydrolase [Anaerorhabdus furcosa]SJZ78783.1 Predicted house-cleaning noncanonical NTP pyrophosphatase, all-alpha NTP-PPase (MazG) superfamily [Anaerorhabdus furcosa]
MYNKLVRDKIPEIIVSQNEIPVTEILSDERFQEELKRKLVEEVNEYLESGEVEELADIMEVVYALSKNDGIAITTLEEIRNHKYKERGGFEQKVFLIQKSKKE